MRTDCEIVMGEIDTHYASLQILAEAADVDMVYCKDRHAFCKQMETGTPPWKRSALHGLCVTLIIRQRLSHRNRHRVLRC